MAVELVTGYAGTAHVSSSEDGARQAGTVGTGMYALETVDEPLKATLENANTVTVGPGDAHINGRHVQLTGSTTFGIPVGTQGQQTSNLLVIRYEVAEDGTESATAITLTGSPSTAEPEDPELATGDILAGDSPVDMPLYRVITTGIETAEPVPLFQTIPPISGLPGVFGNVLDVAHGGTGQTSLMGSSGLLHDLHDNNMTNPAYFSVFSQNWADGGYISKSDLLKLVYPVGAVYVSWSSTSPASLFGGTWTPITGRFPYFNAGTATGGVNSQVLKIEQLPKHVHRTYVGWGSGDETNVLTYNAGTGNKWGGTVGVYDYDTGDVARPGTGTMVTGATEAVNNMPAYQTLYAWRRTA